MMTIKIQQVKIPGADMDLPSDLTKAKRLLERMFLVLGKDQKGLARSLLVEKVGPVIQNQGRVRDRL